MGRFLNRDPIEEMGGLNLYAFVGNDPVNAWDYLGLCEAGYRLEVIERDNEEEDNSYNQTFDGRMTFRRFSLRDTITTQNPSTSTARTRFQASTYANVNIGATATASVLIEAPMIMQQAGGGGNWRWWKFCGSWRRC